MIIKSHAKYVGDSILVYSGVNIVASDLKVKSDRATGNIKPDIYGNPVYSINVNVIQDDMPVYGNVYVSIRQPVDLVKRLDYRLVGNIEFNAYGSGITITADSVEVVSQ